MNIIEKCIILKQELDNLRPLSQEDELRIMQKFRLDWNYHSNHIEGNSLTYGETKALILFNITAQGKPLKDHIEIAGHDEAIKWIEDVVKKNRPLTEHFIRSIHQLLLKNPYEVDALTPNGEPTKKKIKIGEYKSTPNHVKTKTGEIFRFATPEETPAKMMDLIAWYKSEIENKDVEPILLASEFHYKFIRIHPFDDGNGRTARILMNFILMRFGYPPVIIKTEDKENYYSVLRQADAGQFSPFVEYIASNLHKSLEIMISGAKGEPIEDLDDIDKEIALLKHSIANSNKENKIIKSLNIVLDLYENSILPLAVLFFENLSTFDEFYLKKEIWLNGVDWEQYPNSVPIIKDKITKSTPDFRFYYRYITFKKVGFPDFDFSSTISVKLKYSSYEIITDSGFKFRKLYGELISEKECDLLIKDEKERHKRFIESIVKESKDSDSTE